MGAATRLRRVNNLGEIFSEGDMRGSKDEQSKGFVSRKSSLCPGASDSDSAEEDYRVIVNNNDGYGPGL